MMSAFRWLLGPASLVLLAAGLTWAADVIKPNIKPGLWEVVNVPQVKGDLPIPEEQLAKLSPEQRARLEAAFKASSGQTHTYKECMTADKVAKGFDLDQMGEKGNCHKTVNTRSPDEVQLHQECEADNRKTVMDMHFTVAGGVKMTGTVNVVVTGGPRTMTMNSNLTGRWLGSDCGSVKDVEREK